MSVVQLRGMTWDHPRGLDSVVSSNELLIEKCGVSIEWTARSLLAFGDQPIEEFYRDYDLLVIDHPHVPDAVHANGIVPFENLISEDVMSELARTSVGNSHNSYKYQGKQWALAIDTAAQVSAFRADKADGVPIFWSGVITEARKKTVLWAHKPVDAFSTFATLMAQKGKGLYDNGIYVDEDTAEESLEFMVELATLVPDWCATSNPIDAVEILATTNDFAHAVCMYGYSNYSRKGFREHLVRYDDVPSFDGRASGSQLGGAGIAVSSASTNQAAAGNAAAFLSLPEVQSGEYGLNSGQPGNLAAWKSYQLNEVANNFFFNTLRTLERAWVRPRILGWPDVQFQSSLIIHDMITSRKVAPSGVASLNAIFAKYIQE
ncbi:MAG: sugar ABC transporter substrate-binding protein [Actinobacteria bacterium]|nr:sugar ABC transporter substrate-binding protein [Actinomycetota bacterium]